MVLQAHRAQLRKDVLLVFQPAEEGPDLGGARRILPDLEEKGILPKLEAMFALHLTTEYALGSAGILCGSVMASTRRAGHHYHRPGWARRHAASVH